MHIPELPLVVISLFCLPLLSNSNHCYRLLRIFVLLLLLFKNNRGQNNKKI